jgi:hypothetical protein
MDQQARLLHQHECDAGRAYHPERASINEVRNLRRGLRNQHRNRVAGEAVRPLGGSEPLATRVVASSKRKALLKNVSIARTQRHRKCKGLAVKLTLYQFWWAVKGSNLRPTD